MTCTWCGGKGANVECDHVRPEHPIFHGKQGTGGDEQSCLDRWHGLNEDERQRWLSYTEAEREAYRVLQALRA